MLTGVTGSTGQLGGLVARCLSDAGVEQRLLVRDVARAPALPGATPVAFGGYGDAGTAVAALRGVNVLLMVSASEGVDRLEQHRRFVESAVAAGVSRVVYTSFIGAAPQATFTLARDHWATEEALRASGVRYTFLRDNLYLDVLPYFGGAESIIRGPAGQGRVGAVARADIARSAAAVLRDPGAHEGMTYDLTGPEALTLDEIAGILSEVTGTPTTFYNESIEEAYASRAPYNAPPWQVDAWVSTYLAIKNGEMAAVTGAVKALTGSAPMTLRQFLAQR
ncbi:MAG: SDR family oxidoreductase [Vicinamibacterales bacterium]